MAISALSIAAVLVRLTSTNVVEDDQVMVRKELLVAIRSLVDRSLIGGGVINVGLLSWDLVKLYPTTSHHMIIVGYDYSIVCVVLVDAEGSQFDVDCYMTPTDQGLKVIRLDIENWSELKKIVSAVGSKDVSRVLNRECGA